MSGKMREEFEAAYRSVCLSRPVPLFDPAVFTKDRFEDYLNPLVQSAWWAWQASRAALVVELPEAYETDADGHWLIRRAEVKKIIEAQGLKVTP